MAIISLSGVEYKVTEKFRSLINAVDPYNDASGSLDKAKTAFQHAQHTGKPEYLALANDRLALAYAFHSNFEMAFRHYHMAAQLFEELGDSEGVTRVLQNEAIGLRATGNSLEAYRLVHRAIQVARSSAQFELPRALFNAGSITYELGLVDTAVEYLNEAIISAQKSENLRCLARAYSMLGGIQSELGQHAEGIELVEKSIEIGRQTSVKNELLQSQYRLSFVYAAAGQFDIALKIGQEILQGFSEIGLIRGVIEAALLLSDICLKQGNFKLALEYYELAAKSGENRIQPSEEVALIRTRASLLEIEDNIEDAINLLLRALDISSSLTEPPIQIAVEKSLYELYKRSSNNSMALQHFESLAAAEKRHLEQLHASKMQIMLVDREFEKKEYELALERQQIARLESDLAEKVVQITDQVELFSTLRRDLEGIVKKIPADSPAAFDLKKRLRSLPQGVDWKQVEEHFRGVHPRFQLNLSKEFPGLSQTELRLCILLRLNLNSRDISKLFSLSKRTIENHRYNIRKKLGLSAEEDIAKFLAKL